MTTPHERTLAVAQTRRFLEDLQRTHDVPDAVRLEARRLLRHYPQDAVLDLVAGALPQWFSPPDLDDKGS